jgi:succinate-semialdehyde dehydrogenase/glutarate-semialdehyde dehydrogenase
MAAYPDLQLCIGGQWKSADKQPVLNPADESVIGIVPRATRADLDAALAAAESGFRTWRAATVAKNVSHLMQ